MDHCGTLPRRVVEEAAPIVAHVPRLTTRTLKTCFDSVQARFEECCGGLMTPLAICVGPVVAVTAAAAAAITGMCGRIQRNTI